MSNNEIQFIFARFGKNLRKCFIREVLELINIEIKVREFFKIFSGFACAAHSSEENARREHRS